MRKDTNILLKVMASYSNDEIGIKSAIDKLKKAKCSTTEMEAFVLYALNKAVQ